MVETILGLLGVSGAVCLMVWAVPGIRPGSAGNALVAAGTCAALNVAAVRLLVTTPVAIIALKFVSLGVIGVVCNAALLALLARIMDGFELSGAAAALLAALGINAANLFLMTFVL